jgi:hypothetical protein
MTRKYLALMLVAALAVAACGKEDRNTQGNGPGNADGFGGRTDPAPSADAGQRPDAQGESGQAEPGHDEPGPGEAAPSR